MLLCQVIRLVDVLSVLLACPAGGFHAGGEASECKGSPQVSGVAGRRPLAPRRRPQTRLAGKAASPVALNGAAVVDVQVPAVGGARVIGTGEVLAAEP